MNHRYIADHPYSKQFKYWLAPHLLLSLRWGRVIFALVLCDGYQNNFTLSFTLVSMSKMYQSGENLFLHNLVYCQGGFHQANITLKHNTHTYTHSYFYIAPVYQ